ncbi:MAG: hypothetical protein GX820_05090, partial [Bacteroidales bacterium]|nr:hypothetical protein [Bacteroidales bacterium]
LIISEEKPGSKIKNPEHEESFVLISNRDKSTLSLLRIEINTALSLFRIGYRVEQAIKVCYLFDSLK